MFKRRKSIAELSSKIRYEEKRWAQEKILLERQAVIDNEKAELRKKKYRISTSKLLILFLFINCTIIELFTGAVIVKMLSISLITGAAIDFSPLVALIGAVVSEVIGYAVYSLKSTKENTAGGIVYETAIQQQNEPSSNENEDAVG